MPRPVQSVPGEPFASAEEAWFWSVECHLARLEGARPVAGLARVPRPCEPLDVIGAALRLKARGELVPAHFQVLVEYGRIALVPDARLPSQAAPARLWQEALDRLTPPLRAKGIVRCSGGQCNDGNKS